VQVEEEVTRVDVEPALQFRQALLFCAGACVPAAHARHDVLPLEGEKRPAGHTWHDDCPEVLVKEPSGHRRHADWPVSGAYAPGGHATQLLGVPVALAMVPLGQRMHAELLDVAVGADE
jgi:hypothetical protein